MIKHLSGDFETVEYDSQRSVLLYDNHENEAYPIHWHDAIEIIMPLKNHYLITVGGVDYRIEENEVLLVPSGELHSMPEEIPGRRIIFQCDNSVLGEVAALEPVMRALTSTILITPETDKELHILCKKTMLDIFTLYNSHSELADVRIYTALINMLMGIREYQLNLISKEVDEGKIDEYSEKFGMVLKYIDANYMYDISLDQLAGVAGYSKYHFSRIFKQYNSMSYLQYINARRTKAAEQLLKRYPATLDKAEQKARIKKLEADLKAMEAEKTVAADDVVIVDDWMCENGNKNTSP